MKIICIGRNYAEHAKELNNPVPAEPVVFMKPSSALLVNNKPLYYPDFTKNLHFEGELVLKICKNGKAIQKEFAHRYVEEVAFGIDFTARDVQDALKAKGHPWEKAKAFDGSAVLSPFIPLTDLQDAKNIEFLMEKNGEVVQHGFTKDMLFSIEDILVHVSQYFILTMGDLIYTGTPAGVGPVAIGDTLEGFIVTKEGKQAMLHCEIK